MQQRFKVCAAILALSFCTSVCRAQQQTAQLAGVVTDTSGAVIVGATVQIANPSRGIVQHTVTDNRGQYAIPLLPPDDHYTLTVSKAGFGTSIQNELSLQVAQAATVNITLKLGNTVATVTVNASAPLLDTESSAQGQVITGQTVEDLPLNGRSTFRLIALTPGVVFSNGAYGQFGDKWAIGGNRQFTRCWHSLGAGPHSMVKQPKESL
jgi:hypothetical protein